MKVRIQGMLATAAGAALFASAGIALADGMPGGGGYGRPALWSGFYVGGESGWDGENVTISSGGAHANWQRDGIAAGLFAGYQHQFGNLVVGVELNLIGNEFDILGKDPAPEGPGNCPNPQANCIGRITNVFTVGPRVGWSLGQFMPYATGGWASGSVQYIGVLSSGVQNETASGRQDGWFIGGGLDWKLARHVVVGIEYRHTDLGTGSALQVYDPRSGATVPELVKLRADSDSVMVRGSLQFGGRDYAPLK
jgi:outer membrane immunogenic protein